MIKQKIKKTIARIINRGLSIAESERVDSFKSSIFKKFKSPLKRVSFEGIDQLKGSEYILIGEDCFFARGLYLTAWDKYNCCINGKNITQKFSPSISIGKGSFFGAYNHITSINEITIGENIMTGKWVTITDNSHGVTDLISLSIPPAHRLLHSKGPVHIGNNVWIGDKATVLPGVTIGDGVVIGANSVVNQDIPPYSVAVGNPIRIIRKNK